MDMAVCRQSPLNQAWFLRRGQKFRSSDIEEKLGKGSLIMDQIVQRTSEGRVVNAFSGLNGWLVGILGGNYY